MFLKNSRYSGLPTVTAKDRSGADIGARAFHGHDVRGLLAADLRRLASLGVHGHPARAVLIEQSAHPIEGLRRIALAGFGLTRR